MKTKILVTLLLVSILGACGKDKYDTKPKLTFKSINGKTFKQGDVVAFTIEVTDAEGDIQDSIWIEKITRNCTTNKVLLLKNRMPLFTATKNLKADISATFVYNVTNGDYPVLVRSTCTSQNDSATMRFWIKDKGGNVSDTVVSNEFVLLR
jgi:PKD repeat protein